jgi:hypothetical protein
MATVFIAPFVSCVVPRAFLTSNNEQEDEGMSKAGWGAATTDGDVEIGAWEVGSGELDWIARVHFRSRLRYAMCVVLLPGSTVRAQAILW